MWERFIITMKIGSLSNKIKSMENDIMKYRNDMELMNNLYYCGRGDVDSYVEDFVSLVYFRIAVCHRLILRFEDKLDKLNGVVGKS